MLLFMLLYQKSIKSINTIFIFKYYIIIMFKFSFKLSLR